MVFTIDIGNSNIVVGTVNRQGVLFVERMSTDHKKTELEYAILLKSAMEIHGITTNEIKGCIISSVVPPVTSVINRALEKLTGEKALVVGPGIRTGLNIKIDNPAQLGSDLVVDAVAGIAEYPLPLIIIDMGTATAMSAIDAAGNYLGGVIIPGVRVALDSMVSRTAQLPRISFEAPKKAIGKNTIECMKSGSVLGSASMLDGMIDRLEEELSQDATVVATGGIAPFITPHCKHKIVCDDTLLLKGLYLIYNKNC